MDYDKLMAVLPKPPSKWTISDVEVWLQFVGLESLYPAFKKAAIDGSCLPSLTQEDLRSELQIKSSITTKKLMNWINVGLKEYHDFLAVVQQEPPVIHLSQLPLVREKSLRQREKVEFIEEKIEPQQYTTLEKPGPKQRNELIIQQVDGPKGVFQSLREEGGNIGRHSSNQIIILEESVSRHHARIEYKQNEFYIKDIGSTTGTFIKISGKMPLKQGMIIEMGSNCYRIDQCQQEMLLMTIIDEGNFTYEFTMDRGAKIGVGRKASNQISFPDDQHLSNNHAIIFEEGGKMIIEDLKTTNGYNHRKFRTWMRLSPEGEESPPYLLANNTMFRLGTALTYQCKKNTAEIVERSSSNACAACKQVDRDCLYLPCKHVYTCMGCSMKFQECKMCGIRIQQYVKMFRC